MSTSLNYVNPLFLTMCIACCITALSTSMEYLVLRGSAKCATFCRVRGLT